MPPHQDEPLNVVSNRLTGTLGVAVKKAIRWELKRSSNDGRQQHTEAPPPFYAFTARAVGAGNLHGLISPELPMGTGCHDAPEKEV
jgi:hypothetical protein